METEKKTIEQINNQYKNELEFIYKLPKAFKDLNTEDKNKLIEICNKLNVKAEVSNKNYSAIIKTIKNSIFENLKNNNNSSFVSQLIFGLNVLNNDIIKDAINFDSTQNKLIKAEDRIKQAILQNNIEGISDFSQVQIHANNEKSANDTYIMENISTNKKYYIKTFSNDSGILDPTNGKIHPNELLVYKILEKIGLGPKTWFLIRQGSSSGGSNSIYSGNYIMTENVAEQDQVFYKDLDAEIDEKISTFLEQDKNFAFSISLAASVNHILSLADTFGANGNNYGVVMSKTNPSDYKIQFIDHLPKANNGILSKIKNSDIEMTKYSPRDALSKIKQSPLTSLAGKSYSLFPKGILFQNVSNHLFNNLYLEQYIDSSKKEIISLIDKYGVNFVENAENELEGYCNKIFENIATYKKAAVFTSKNEIGNIQNITSNQLIEGIHLNIKEEKKLEEFNQPQYKNFALQQKNLLEHTEIDLDIQKIVASLARWANEASWEKLEQKSAEEKRLIEEANKFGYKAYDVARDGNCLFHSVAHQLNQQSKEHCYTHEELRANAIRELCNHPERYEDFCDKDVDGGIEQMILNNVKSGSWADMGEVLAIALSRAINISLIILRNDGAEPTIYRRTQNLDGTERPIVYIGNEVGWHFQSLVPLDEPEAANNRFLLLERFEATVPDTIDNLNSRFSSKMKFK